MSRWRRSLVVLGVVGLAGTSAPARADSTVVERLALIIGSNQGGPDRTPLRYAASDAQAMANVLEGLGGLRREETLLLRNPDRSAVLRALEELARRTAARRGPSRRTEVLLYYSGHSDDEGLLLGGERLTYGELRAQIAHVDADVMIVILDSCSSGAFTRRKGGTPRPPFLVDDSIKVRGHAFLASSSVREAAQESDRIGGSYFTHYLLTGLRGAADVSGDHRVTLSEAYNFAFNETLAGTEQTLGGAQHPAYDIQLVGTGDVVMTDLHQTSAVLTLPRGLWGRLYLRDQAGLLAAELSKQPGRIVELGLEPGRYRLTLSRDGQLYTTDVVLAAGHSTSLDEGSLRSVVREATALRGPLEETAVPFNLSLVPAISINRQLGHGATRNTFSLGLVGAETDRLSGVAIAGVWNEVRRDAQGVLLAGFANQVEGRVDGVEVSGGWNTAAALHGLQLSIVNWADEVQGVQFGLVNLARRVRGAQLGVVNVAEDVDGASWGVASWVQHGTHSLEVGASDFLPATAVGKLGAQVYGIIGGGADPTAEPTRYALLTGVGVHLRDRPRYDLALDGITAWVHRGDDFGSDHDDRIFDLRLTFGLRLDPRLVVYIGPSLHVEVTDVPNTSASSVLSSLEHVWHSGQSSIRLGPGLAAGLRLF